MFSYGPLRCCNGGLPHLCAPSRVLLWFVKDLISSDDNSPQGQQAIWLASVDEYGAILRPYLSGGFIVFANTDGDAIAFDGWTIRSIVGFGFAGPLSIYGKDGNRTIRVGELLSAKCDPWRLSRINLESSLCQRAWADSLRPRWQY